MMWPTDTLSTPEVWHTKIEKQTFEEKWTAPMFNAWTATQHKKSGNTVASNFGPLFIWAGQAEYYRSGPLLLVSHKLHANRR